MQMAGSPAEGGQAGGPGVAGSDNHPAFHLSSPQSGLAIHQPHGCGGGPETEPDSVGQPCLSDGRHTVNNAGILTTLYGCHPQSD
ncbi:hypothetical protein ACOMHN_000804 [Nucella lapillus]